MPVHENEGDLVDIPYRFTVNPYITANYTTTIGIDPLNINTVYHDAELEALLSKRFIQKKNKKVALSGMTKFYQQLEKRS